MSASVDGSPLACFDLGPDALASGRWPRRCSGWTDSKGTCASTSYPATSGIAWSRVSSRRRQTSCDSTEPRSTRVMMHVGHTHCRPDHPDPGVRARRRNTLDSASRRGLTMPSVVQRRFDELGTQGRSGVTVFNRVMESAGVQSWLERQFLSLIKAAGLPKPRVQRTFRADGQHIARVDFDFERNGVVVEVGGRRGYLSLDERRRQERRRNALQLEGRTIYFFTTEDVLEDGPVCPRHGQTEPLEGRLTSTIRTSFRRRYGSWRISQHSVPPSELGTIGYAARSPGRRLVSPRRACGSSR